MNKRNELIENHYLQNYDKLCRRVVRRVLNNSPTIAQEVVQEAYTRALYYYRAFDPKINDFDAWFNGILRNAVNDSRRDEKDHGATYELYDNIEDMHPPNNLDVAFFMRKVEDVDSKRDQHILWLFYIVGYKSRDIGKYLTLNHNTVRQVIFQFRNKLNE